MDGLEQLRMMLESCGAKRYKALTSDLEKAANPVWTGDRTFVDQAVETVLWQLHRQPFEPGRDNDFWQGAAGQLIASAIYNAHLDDLVKPAEAARLLFPEASNPIAIMRDWVRSGKLHAFPRPEWSKNKKTKYQRLRRGSIAHVCWMVSRAEVEHWARCREGSLAQAS